MFVILDQKECAQYPNLERKLGSSAFCVNVFFEQMTKKFLRIGLGHSLFVLVVIYREMGICKKTLLKGGIEWAEK